MARILYVGAVVIQAEQPKELARWYAEKFGLPTTFEHSGGYWGGFDTSAGPVQFGIIPRENPGESGRATVSVMFRVNDFPGYLQELKKRGLEPVGPIREDGGQVAAFRDPEGNEVAICGE
jgi:predicted enzyme related to lactoylglutathione lyase